MFRMLGENPHSVEKSISSEFMRGILSVIGGVFIILLLVLVVTLNG